jgi:NTE family protein
MASGALPPGFPAVEIDGEFYWDGGLVSNTPLSEVIGGLQRNHTLVFQVDLWSATGQLPADLNGIAERTQEIQFSSRTRMVTDVMLNTRMNALMVKELLSLIPSDVRKQNEVCRKAEGVASCGEINIIQLIYKNKPYEGHYKDYEFSLDTMEEHWSSGLLDIQTSLAQPGWLDFPVTSDGVITHDIHRLAQP